MGNSVVEDGLCVLILRLFLVAFFGGCWLVLGVVLFVSTGNRIY